MPHIERLEIQYDETPLFDELVAGALPKTIGGKTPYPMLRDSASV